MTDKEIIKALNKSDGFEHISIYCADNKGDYIADVKMTYLADLINRQQAEIENYIKVAEYQQNLTLKKSFEIKELKAEIERLQKENNQFADIGKMYSEIKSEAIKEFAEKVKKYFNPDSSYDFRKWIDNLVKEMVGE